MVIARTHGQAVISEKSKQLLEGVRGQYQFMEGLTYLP